jgi:hypothetical protein
MRKPIIAFTALASTLTSAVALDPNMEKARSAVARLASDTRASPVLRFQALNHLELFKAKSLDRTYLISLGNEYSKMHISGDASPEQVSSLTIALDFSHKISITATSACASSAHTFVLAAYSKTMGINDSRVPNVLMAGSRAERDCDGQMKGD